MRKKIVLTPFVSMLLLFAILGAKFSMVVVASPNVIRVPDDHPTIQAAIDVANPGDTVQVAAGTYYERVNVTKTISLIGEDPNTTIIDGSGIGTVVSVNASNVKIETFTIQNGGEWPYSGILMYRSDGHVISNNIIRENYYGLDLLETNSSNILGNTIVNNSYAGIKLSGNNNIFYGNTITNNSIGVWVSASFSPNILYHNNFVNNTNQALIFAPTEWDNGAEGNYWRDYEGSDVNGDGIGDTLIPHLGVDKYPLIEPWSLTRVFPVELGGQTFYVTVQSNSTVASFNFDHSLRQISFRITGPSGMTFFCNVTVPKTLLNVTPSESWTVQLNNTDITDKSSIIENADTSVYFAYSLSTYEVRIRVVKVGVVNFIPYAIGFGVAIVVISLTMFVMLKKKKRNKKPECTRADYADN